MRHETPTIAEAVAMLRLALADQAPGFLPVEVIIRGHAGKIRWPIGDGSDVAAARPSASVACVPDACRQWSPTEKAILEALADGEWKTAITIAEDSRLGRSTSFQAILANLVEAGILESSHKSGYRLVSGNPQSAIEAEAKSSAPSSSIRLRGLSPLEQAAVNVLADGNWRTGQEIADALGLPRNNSFNVIMANLVETGSIESNQNKGYRLTPTEGLVHD